MLISANLLIKMRIDHTFYKRRARKSIFFPLLFAMFMLCSSASAICTDSSYVKKCRTVGVILSGGGAKGAAHIGVIEHIEKLGIPVDMVLGTSMGGLIGSLYALGYTPAQMDSIIRNIDWRLSERPKRFRKTRSSEKSFAGSGL